jgi:hypothetical protein
MNDICKGWGRNPHEKDMLIVEMKNMGVLSGKTKSGPGEEPRVCK